MTIIAPVTPAIDAPNQVLFWLMRLTGVGDGELAERIQISRQAVYNRRVRGATMSAVEVGRIAAIFEVPIELFYGSPRQAIDWLLEHRPDWFDPSDNEGPGSPVQESTHSRCTVPLTRHITDSAPMSDDVFAELGYRQHPVAA